MIDWLAVLVGLFLLAAIVKNKDLSDKKRGNEDVFTYMTIFVIFLVLGGLGFLMKNRTAVVPNMALLIPFQICLATVAVSTKGTVKLVALIGALSTLVYIIAGSFM